MGQKQPIKRQCVGLRPHRQCGADRSHMSHDTGQWNTSGNETSRHKETPPSPFSGLQIWKETCLKAPRHPAPLPPHLTLIILLTTQSGELDESGRPSCWNDVFFLAETRQIKIQEWLTASRELGHLRAWQEGAEPRINIKEMEKGKGNETSSMFDVAVTCNKKCLQKI